MVVLQRLSRVIHLSALLLVSSAGVAQEQTFLFDFGAVATDTTNGGPPDDPLRFWNNITLPIGSSNTGQLLNVVTTGNSVTDIDFFMVSRFNGANSNGTTASTAYPIDATRDSLFGNTEDFGGLSNVFPVFKLSSLDPDLTYNFTFYASRTGVGDNRTTNYFVSGGSSGSTTLNAANNIDTTASVFGISPDGAGEITISLTPAAANNNSNHFTYMGVLEVVAVPEPGSALMLGTAVVVFAGRRRRPLRIRAFSERVLDQD
jgi:hypothetical protein